MAQIGRQKSVGQGENPNNINKTHNATQQIRRLYNVKDHLLGSGAFGKVYLAESKIDSATKFAVKVIPMKQLSGTLKEMMHDELKILYKLDHPFICQYIESFEDEKYIYIVMEYCPGKVLMSRLEEQGTFTEYDAAKAIYKIMEGLNHIHNVSVVHRDLKPENIIIDDNGDPKIIDFGLSKDTNNGVKQLKSIVGSKLYMAPEILLG